MKHISDLNKGFIVVAVSVIVLCPIFAPFSTSAEKSANYIYTELNPGNITTHIQAVDINNKGVVLGNVIFWGFLYSEGTYTTLPHPPGSIWGYPGGINDQGMVVGTATYQDYTDKGFLYSEGTYTEMLPAGWKSSRAYSINNKGVVLGDGYDGNYVHHNFLYSAGTYTVLPVGGWPIGLNVKGDVITWAVELAFLYSEGIVTELLPPNSMYVYANGINNKGVVVGCGRDKTVGQYLGYMYSEGVYTTLHPLGWIASCANSINDKGMVVGAGADQTGTAKGFVYSEGTYTEFMLPGWDIIYPTSINEEGIIVGYGYDGTSIFYRSFMATLSQVK